MVLKRNLGIKCALFTIDRLLGLGQGVRTQFQRIAWKLLGKLELCNLFLPVSLVSYPAKDLPHMLFFLPSGTKESFKTCQCVHLIEFCCGGIPGFCCCCCCLSQPGITRLLVFNVNLKLEKECLMLKNRTSRREREREGPGSQAPWLHAALLERSL